MNSHIIKTVILCWFRFGKRWQYLATEVGGHRFLADVVASDGKELVEVEVKISKSDFKNDFLKKDKHTIYQKEIESTHETIGWVPHKMYYAVPESMVEWALEYLKDKPLKYGLISISEYPHLWHGKSGASIVLKAKKLHNKKLHENIVHQICMRMASELCNLYIHGAGVNQLTNSINEFREWADQKIDIENIADGDLKDVVGKWPGDETDEQISKALK